MLFTVSLLLLGLSVLLLWHGRRERARDEAVRQALPPGAVVLDADGTVRSWSPSTERLLGYAETEAAGGPILGFESGELARLGPLIRRVATEGAPLRFTARAVRKGGDRAEVIVDLAPLLGQRGRDGLPLVVAALTEVTEQEQLRRELAEAGERWRVGVEAVGEGILDWDLASGRLRASPLALALLDEPAERTVLPVDALWQLVWPEDRAALREAADRMASGEGTGSVTVRIGSERIPMRWIRFAGSAVRDAEGRPTRVITAIRDVTETTISTAVRDAVSAMHEGLLALELFRSVADRVCRILLEPLGLRALAFWERESGEGLRVAAGAPDEIEPELGRALVADRTVIVRFAPGEASPRLIEAATDLGFKVGVGVPVKTSAGAIGALTGFTALDRTPDARIVAALESVAGGFAALQEASELRARLFLHDAALQSAANGIVILDSRGVITHANSAFAGMARLPVRELVGRRLDGLLADVESGDASAERAAAEAQGEPYRQERALGRAGETPLPVHLSISPIGSEVLRDQAEQLVAKSSVAIVEDLSERKEHEAHVVQLRRYDGLTGLPNRALFLDQARAAIARAERSSQRVALLFINLDHFKRVNDSLGHSGGDAVLRSSAERLAAQLRPTDLIARLGGDEFAILLGPVRDASEAGSLAQRLLAVHEAPLDAQGIVHHVGISIGISLFPDDGHDAEELIQHADLAMYRAKADGRQTLHFFAKTMDTHAVRRGALERSLHSALRRNEFRVVYQPQLRLADGALYGAEALVRFRSPELGDVAPGEFITVAEDLGIIRQIGMFVFRTAARQLAAWDSTGLPRIRIAVNLSMAQFRSSTLARELAEEVAAAGVDPSRIELELTETMLAENAERAEETVRELHASGFELAIDDFGIGYSSMLALRKYPLARLKIDRSFVMELEQESSSAAIVRATVGLAHSLGLSVIAEGVETEGQELFLRGVGCDEVQGYRYAKPLEVEAFAEWALERHARRPQVTR